MLRTGRRLLLSLVLAIGVVLAQGPAEQPGAEVKTVRVGVANLLNQTSRYFNSSAYRAQLVSFLNEFGTDRKEQIMIEAVALNATSRKSANAEAASKQCQYVLLTTVRDISRLGSVRVGEDGIAAVPDVALGARVSGDRAIVVEFEANRVARSRTVSQGSMQPTNSPRADEQLTELVQMEAMRVAHDLRNDKVSVHD